MRTLVAQIYEAGTFHDNAITQKRGLVNAFAERGAVTDWDYLTNERNTLYDGFAARIEYLNADLVFTQFHSADRLLVGELRALKQRFPHVMFVNWSGDSWAWSLTSPAILELAREYDLWMVAAPDVLPVYAERGINAAFWQIAYEPSVTPLPDMPTYDVVFLGNVISDKRRQLIEFLRDEIENKYTVGIYGDHERRDGHNTYHFAEGEALYKNATLAIADMAYVDQTNYISNRPFQILAAGGALLLHQHVERMDVLSGLVAGQHFIEWSDFDDLREKIAYWLDISRTKQRRKIVNAGKKFALANHTWRERVRVLVDELLPTVEGERV